MSTGWLLRQNGRGQPWIARAQLGLGHKGQAHGFFDNLKSKLAGGVDRHGDKVGDGLDQAADFVDDKTGGTNSARIDAGAETAKRTLDGLDGQDDDIA